MDLRFIFEVFMFFPDDTPKSRFARRWVLDLVSGAALLAQPALLLEPDPLPGLPGPAVGPGGRKSTEKAWAGPFFFLPNLKTR